MRAIWLLVLFVVAAAAQSQTAGPGRLLVASESPADSNLAESVVLLLEHGERGTAGLIINRPTWVEPADAFPDLEDLGGLGSLYLGGLVGHGNLSVLVRGPIRQISGTHRVLNDVYFTDQGGLRRLAEDDGSDHELRLYAGLVSWEPGELEREIERGAWNVATARAELIFHPRPQRLWHQLHQALPELTVGVR